jgi:hypothetical protein
MRIALTKAGLCGGLLAVLLTGCVTKYDYSNYRAHFPRSILVLPPLNETTDVGATYGYLSTVTRPLAEMGYYVFPVAVVDRFFKENGMPGAGEMHQAPLNKIVEIMGADAVLYFTLKQYGTKYQVINSKTVVEAQGRLVDTRTGTVLWEGKLLAQENSSSGSVADLFTAILGQVINQATDHAHDVAHYANAQLALPPRGLLLGPRHPRHGTD